MSVGALADAGDAGSAGKVCAEGADSRCVPGCTTHEHDKEAWCNVYEAEKDGGYCQGKPFRPGDLGGMLTIHRQMGHSCKPACLAIGLVEMELLGWDDPSTRTPIAHQPSPKPLHSQLVLWPYFDPPHTAPWHPACDQSTLIGRYALHGPPAIPCASAIGSSPLGRHLHVHLIPCQLIHPPR